MTLPGTACPPSRTLRAPNRLGSRSAVAHAPGVGGGGADRVGSRGAYDRRLSPEPVSAPQPPLSRKWILVVEDDPTVRNLFKDLLEQQGYPTLTCADALDAFEFVRTVLPDLVILDLRMERAPGRVFLEKLATAEAPVLRQIPVLIVSAYLEEDRPDVAGVNIVGQMEKPVDRRALLQKVRDVLDPGSPAQ